MSLALSEGGGVEGRGVVGVEGVGVETEGEAGVELVVLMGVEGEGDVTDDEGVGEATDDEGTGDATDWGDDTWYFHQKLFNKIIIYIFLKKDTEMGDLIEAACLAALFLSILAKE